METQGLTHWADILIVVVYFVVVLGIGLLTLCKPKRSNVQNYFLAGRTMPWFAVGASLFSSNIGSEHFVGLAGAGAAAGIALVLFEWFPIFLILMLGWLFIPVYISAGVYTLPEFIERRHGGRRLRMYLSCLSLVLYIITKLAAAMFSGALFIQMALKWNMYVSLAVLLTVTGLYTILGGLTAVMYTDTFQTAVMVIGSAVVMIASFVQIGGYNNLERRYFEAFPSSRSNTSSCGLPRPDAFHVFQDPVTGDQPWPGLVLQASLGCLWYWCCDQVIHQTEPSRVHVLGGTSSFTYLSWLLCCCCVPIFITTFPLNLSRTYPWLRYGVPSPVLVTVIVQRSLAAKSLSHAKGGSILAGLLKILPLFLLIFPGMISRILFPDEVACADPVICKRVCDNPVGCSNIAYPKLVLELLPVGARGLLIAVMLSAIMSSLTSIFNSASTVFTMDVWRRLRPDAKQRELLVVGRLFIVMMCVIAILWVPMVKAFQSGRLFNYMTAVEGYIGSPLGVLFLLSIFSTRITEAGAFYGLIIGHICGVCRFIIELVHPAPPCGEGDTRPSFLSKFHYTYYVQLQLLLTAIATALISMFTKARTDEELIGVTWWTKHESAPHLNQDNVEMIDKVENNVTSIVTESEPPINVDGSEVPSSTCKHWLEQLCGIRDTDETKEDVKKELRHIQSFLKQGKSTSKVLNFAAVMLIVIVSFITAFYH